MSYITAFLLFGLFSQLSLAKSVAEPNTGCTDFCFKSVRLVLDQQLITQLQMNNMENNWKIQHEWSQNVLNLVNQNKLENRQTLEAFESRLVRLESVENKLIGSQGTESNDTDIVRLSERLGGLERQITEQQVRAALGQCSGTERLDKLEDQQRQLVSGAEQILNRLAQIEKQIAVEQSKVLSDQLPQESERVGRALEDQGRNTSFLDELRDRVQVLEKQISGQDETVSTNMSRLANGISGIKEQLADEKLKHLTETAKIKERIGNLEKDLADKQINIELKESKLTEVLNGLKNQFAGHETKLIAGENKLLDSQSKLSKLQNQLTSQQDTVSKHEAAIKDSESKVKQLWKNRLVTFQNLGSKYYYFEKSEKLNWTDARDRCQELGGHLASLQNQEEFDLVTRDIYDPNYYWLDINDIENEGVYMSSTTGDKANFLKWRVAPDNWKGAENCVELAYISAQKVMGMNDLDCSEKQMYICEKKL